MNENKGSSINRRDVRGGGMMTNDSSLGMPNSNQTSTMSNIGAESLDASVHNRDPMYWSMPNEKNSKSNQDIERGMRSELNQGWTSSLIIAILQGITGPLLYGYNISVLNVPKNNIEDAVKYNLDNSMYDILTTAFCFGGMIGSLTGGKLSDALGRRTALLLNNGIFVLGSLVLFFLAKEYYACFILGRALIGVGGGIATAVAPTYLGEISPNVIRGAVGTLNQLTICFGIVVANVLGYHAILGSENHDLWEYLLGFSAVVSIFQWLFWKWFPESPKWLMQAKSKNSTSSSSSNNYDQEARARQTLQWLRQSEDVEYDMDLIRAAMEPQQNKYQGHKSSDKQELLGSESNSEDARFKRIVRKALLVSVMLQVLQQLSGINSVFYYSQTTFENAGINSSFQQWIATVSVGVANFLAVFVAVALMDRSGRRKLLFMSFGGMAISSLLLSIGLFFENKSDIWGYLCVVFMVLYVICFEIGLGPIPWLIVAEITPTSHRGTIMSLASAANWGGNLLIAQFANPVVEDAKYLPFMAICILGVLFVAKYVPETKEKSDAEIQDELAA